jgi:hypothetical protein
MDPCPGIGEELACKAASDPWPQRKRAVCRKEAHRSYRRPTESWRPINYVLSGGLRRASEVATLAVASLFRDGWARPATEPSASRHMDETGGEIELASLRV